MLGAMPRISNRVNVVLDDEHSTKLRRLAERTHTNPGTIARSLLATALDDADPDARSVTALLDAIPGAFEQAEQGSEEVRSGLGTPLEDF
jgi:predicted transcriptional regulator